MLEDNMLLALRVVKWWGSATATGGQRRELKVGAYS